MLSLPLPTIDEMINVVIQEAVIEMYVLMIALNCPSSTATAELNDG